MKSIQAIIDKEESKLRELDLKEKIVRENSRDMLIEEGSPIKSIPLVNRDSLDKILEEQGLLTKTRGNGSNNQLSSKSKRSKRYYIRKRLNEGKPYIPARIRALGKKRARELGFIDWERRLAQGREEEISKHEEMMNKLSVVMRLIIRTRLSFYLERIKK